MGLKEKLQTVPARPGVYLFKDKEGKVLYVGKARLLRDRVRQYFQPSRPADPFLGDFVAEIADLDLVLTDNEMEALALENNFIALADVHDGPLADWILTSGLTHHEVVAIQVPAPGGGRDFVRPEPAPEADPEIVRLHNIYLDVQRQLAALWDESLEQATDALMRRPDLARALCGSEGTLGFITSAVLRIHKKPEARMLAAFVLPSFDAAINAVHLALREEAAPSGLRISDTAEARASFGAWADLGLDWEDVENELDRIRHNRPRASATME